MKVEVEAPYIASTDTMRGRGEWAAYLVITDSTLLGEEELECQ